MREYPIYRLALTMVLLLPSIWLAINGSIGSRYWLAGVATGWLLNLLVRVRDNLS